MVQYKNKELIKSGETFYVDACQGNDENTGTDPQHAWKTFANVAKLRLGPGGKLLLKRGCIWNGEPLRLVEAEGTAEHPVLVGSYASGAAPVINGKGNGWNRSGKVRKEDAAVVHIYNCRYLILENLEVTNLEEQESRLVEERALRRQSKSLLTGILVENHNAGMLSGIHIRKNYVHDVNSYMDNGRNKGAGGIIVLVTGEKTESGFVELAITGNEVEHVCHEAIYMESSWAARKLVGGQDGQKAGKGRWIGWQNVYVANNYVHNVAGDGIVLINVDGGIAEKNLIVRSACEEWNNSRNRAHAALWMWNCNNVTMQYNEASYTESFDDGMAFDFDFGNQNVLYQYNYSHHNKGGFWMSCPCQHYTINAVCRYNISINDAPFDGSRLLRVGEKGSIGNQFYNNTIYWDHGYRIKLIEQAVYGIPVSGGTDIYNNIFCGDCDSCDDNEGMTFQNNCIYKTAAAVYPKEKDLRAILQEPEFAEPSDYTEGEFADGEVKLGSVKGFCLKSSSPCIGAGIEFMDPPQVIVKGMEDELVKSHISIENRDYTGYQISETDEKGLRRIDVGAVSFRGTI